MNLSELNEVQETEFKKLYFMKGRTRNDVEKFAKINNLSISTIYRWFKRFDQNTNTINLNHVRKGNRSSRIDPDVERLIREEISHFKRSHFTISDIHKAINLRIVNINRLHGLHLNQVSYVTVRRRFYLSRNL